MLMIKLVPLVLMAGSMMFLLRGNNEKPDYFWFSVTVVEAFLIQYGMVN